MNYSTKNSQQLLGERVVFLWEFSPRSTWVWQKLVCLNGFCRWF